MKNRLLNRVIYMTKLFTYAFVIQGLTMSFLMAENGKAQNKSIEEVMVRIPLIEVSVEEVFSKLEKSTEYNFVYTNRDIADIEKVTINGDNQSVYDVLLLISQQTKLQFKQVNKNIHVKKAQANSGIKEPVSIVVEDFVIRGKVTDQNDEPLPGASLLVEGTTIGTISDIDGNYSFSVPDNAQVLIVSYIGYVQQRININGSTSINVKLVEDLSQLGEVVVTAFGLQREERSLGIAVGKVDNKQISQNPQLNVANSLAGRVSGVQVDESGGPSGSSRVIIRGFSSLGGNNQPLYVVDGIPIDNSSRVTAGYWGGRDGGDGIQNINPNDIQEISVLKGPNAAALYGERGANGVILITTKSGSSRQGIGVEVNSNVRMGRPMIWPDFQNQFGEGANGDHRFYTDGQGNIVPAAQAQGQAGLTGIVSTIRNGPQHPKTWGPALNGQPVYQWDGQLLPFSPQPNNVRNFFQDEVTFDNSVSLGGGNDVTNFRLSLGNVNNKGMVPTNTLNRNTVSLRAVHKLNDRFTIEGKVNFVEQKANNRPGLSDDQRNIYYQFRGMPRNTYFESLQRYELSEQDLNNPNALQGYLAGQRVEGWSRHWTNGTHTENPYWVINNINNNDSRQRVMGFLDLKYKFADWLSANLKAGTDFYTDNRHTHDAVGTRVNQIGGFSEITQQFREDNVQFLLMGTKRINPDFEVSVNVGGNYMRSDFQNTGFSGSRLSVPGLYVINNMAVQNPQYSISQREIQSVFAFGQFNFKDYWYVDWTVRNDWSSTLPKANQSFMYPSLSSNFVWSDALNIDSRVLSFASVRASWAQAGNSADPYRTVGTYSLQNFPLGGRPGATFQGTIPNTDLKAELTTSLEIGTDFRLFDGRVRFDATYYKSVTENQILNIQVAPSSGFGTRAVNAGEIQNSGLEMMLNAMVFERGDFTWNASINWARNRNQVVSLVEGIERYQLGNARNVAVFADPGQPFGAIYTRVGRWVRDDEGNRIIDPSNGLPVKELGQFRIGNAMPKWTGGISNTFTYKNFSLFALVDMRYGGDIFSISNVYEALYGVTNRTVPGRDGTYVAEGVIGSQNAEGVWTSTGTPNTMQIQGETYWSHVVPQQAAAIGEEMLNSATFVKLRELRLGFDFPASITRKLGVNQLNLSAVGQNLFYFTRHTDGFSPESAAFNLGQAGIGIESFSWPQMRSMGFNLRLVF